MLFWKTYPFGLYTVRKEIKKNGDFEILHEIVEREREREREIERVR